MPWPRRLRAHPVASGLGLVLLALMLAFGICEWKGWPFLRAPLQRTLSQRLDRDVRIGSGFTLHLLRSFRLRTDLLAIGPPRWAPKAGDDKFFEAHDVQLQLPWSTLWNVAMARRGGPLHVSALEVGRFDAVLWRRPDGRANWDFKRAQSASNGTAAELPEFDRLVVRNGRLSLDDAPTGLTLHAQAETQEGLTAGPQAGLQIRGDGRYREGDFNFTMRSTGVLPLIEPEGSGVSVPITLHGHTPQAQVVFEGQARDVIHLDALTGSFRVSGRSLAEVGAPFGVTLPTTAPFETDGKLAKDGELWKVGVARLDVGSSRLAGDFSFDRRPKVPLLSGILRGQRLDLHDLGPAFGAPVEGAPNPPRPPGRLFPDREFNIPSLQRMNADVGVELQHADLHTALLAPLEPLKGHIVLRDGMLRIEQLLARTSGGEIKGAVELDGRKVQHPVWKGDLRISGVQLARWLQLHDTHGKPGAAASGNPPAKRYITGRLGGHLQFTGRGRSVADMMGSLDGTLAAWVNDGRVSHLAMEAAGIDLAQAIGVLVRGDDALQMTCAVAQFTARDGVLRSDVALIDSPDTTIIVNGDISLAKEQLALVAHADPKDFSPVALRAPIHVEGSFRKPHVRLETKPIAVKAVTAVALGVVNPLAALIPLMDPGQKAPEGCSQALNQLRSVRGVEPAKVQTSGTEKAAGGNKAAPARQPAPQEPKGPMGSQATTGPSAPPGPRH